MRLRFDPSTGDDEDAYHDAAALLLEQLDIWARVTSSVDDNVANDARLLLDWRYGYSTGELDRFDHLDLEDFLLNWCPRKLSAPPETWLGVVEGARAWITFLAFTNRWSGPPMPGLLARLEKLKPRFLDAMGDPSNFGMAKGMMSGLALRGADLDLDDPESLRAAMEAFNALPDDERIALTDPFMGNLGGAPRITLPLTPAPDPHQLEIDAAAAPILRQIDALRTFLGESGKLLTAKGNPKVADARAMVPLLETGEIADQTVGEHTYKLRSADELPHLCFLLDLARDASAVRVLHKRMLPTKTWAKRSDIDKLEALFDIALNRGPLTSLSGWRMRTLDALVEDGLVHLLVGPFVAGSAPYADLYAHVLEVVRANPDRFTDRLGEKFLPGQVARLLDQLFDIVERCGLVVWTPAEHEGGGSAEDPVDPVLEAAGVVPLRFGGEIRITEVGRELLPKWLDEAGYELATTAGLDTAEPAELLDALLDSIGMEPEDLWSRWWPNRSDVEKAAALVALLPTVESAEERGVIVTMAGVHPAAAEPAMRALLDGPFAGHAAMFLISHELSAPDDLPSLDPALSLAPMVDMIASLIALDPDDAASVFDEVVPRHDQEGLIADLWQVDLPETLYVLDAIGRVGSRGLAKAARKAAHRHRSRFPNR